jgi:hypothetical protein
MVFTHQNLIFTIAKKTGSSFGRKVVSRARRPFSIRFLLTFLSISYHLRVISS